MSDLKPDSGETSGLLDEIRHGQPAFDRLFTRHRDALRATVSLRFDPALRGRLDPSDVVQDTQMEAFRRLPEYLQRQPMPFHLWLRKMAYERLIMMRRRHLGASCRAVGNELPLPEQSSVMLAKNLLANEKSPSQQVAACGTRPPGPAGLGSIARHRSRNPADADVRDAVLRRHRLRAGN